MLQQVLSWFSGRRPGAGRSSAPRRRPTLGVERLEERAQPAAPAGLPGFVVTPVLAGLHRPTSIDFAPDGRLFVAEKFGALRVVQNGTLLPTPFVTLPVNGDDER